VQYEFTIIPGEHTPTSLRRTRADARNIASTEARLEISHKFGYLTMFNTKSATFEHYSETLAGARILQRNNRGVVIRSTALLLIWYNGCSVGGQNKIHSVIIGLPALRKLHELTIQN
jgi:hypothetical protein